MIVSSQNLYIETNLYTFQSRNKILHTHALLSHTLQLMLFNLGARGFTTRILLHKRQLKKNEKDKKEEKMISRCQKNNFPVTCVFLNNSYIWFGNNYFSGIKKNH